jgi:hypothetical protein
MSANFKITTYKNNNELNIDLAGDFDGNSAWELIHAITRHDPGEGDIIIHTNKLGRVIPFGQAMFDTLIGTNRIARRRICFKGEKCGLMQLDGYGRRVCGKSGSPCTCTGNCPNCTCRLGDEETPKNRLQ